MSRQTIYAINAPINSHLDMVVTEMALLGAPVVRAVNCGDFWVAIEGSHRIAAAHKLGLPVMVAEVQESDEIDSHDLEDLPLGCTASEIMEYMFRGTPEAAYSVEIEEV